MTNAEDTLVELGFITEHWDDLLELRQPGTRRPWRQALIDPERRAQNAQRDREERAVRDPDAPGFTSAPEHIDILDVIVGIWTTIDELVALISPDWRRTTAGGAIDRPAAEHGPARVTEITTMVDFIHLWLPTADTDPRRLARITRRLGTLNTEISRVLSLVRAGQLLNGALCPWCRGVTPKHPAGGATTLRVEEIPGSRTLGTDPAAAVVCWNSLCEPPEHEVGNWYRGRPAWPWHEWDWLADRLIIADRPRVGGLLTETQFGDSVPVIHSGRSGVDQALCVTPTSAGALAGVRFIDNERAG